MDERQKFDKWFAETYGQPPYPNCDIQDLEGTINDYTKMIEAVLTYEAKYSAALAAWSESKYQNTSVIK